MMLKIFTLAALATTVLTSAALANGPELLIQDFVGTVKIENNSSDNISITRDKNMIGVNLVEQGDNLKIDGGITDPDGNKCKGYYGSYSLGLFKKNTSGEFGGYEDLEDYPQITILLKTPLPLSLQRTLAERI